MTPLAVRREGGSVAPGSRWRDLGLPGIAYVVASLVMVGPQLWPLSRISALSYHANDANIFLWNFWWTRESVAAFESPYWTPLLFHPSGTSLAFHSYPLPYSLLSLPVQWLKPGVDGLALSFNLIVFLSFVLSAFGAYLLARQVTGSRWGSLVAGLLFAFGPFHFLNMSRLHVLVIEVMPFYLLALVVTLKRPRALSGMLLGVSLALAYYSSLEYALHLLMFSALWLVYVLCLRRESATRRFFASLALATVSFAILAAPLLLLQLHSLGEAGQSVQRSLEESTRWSPALLSLISPSRIHPLYGQVFAFLGEFGDGTTVGMRSESSLGIAMLSLVGVAILAIRRGDRAFWLCAALVFLCLSLGPYLRVSGTWGTSIPLPYGLLYDLLPPLRAGRDPTRFIAITSLLLSLVAAYGVSDLVSRFGNRRGRDAVVLLIVSAVLFELLVPDGEAGVLDLDPVYERIAEQEGDFALIDLSPDQEALLAQTIHRRPITWVGKLIPRSENAGDMLRIEFEFRQPARVLGAAAHLNPEMAAARLRDLEKLKIGFLILPNGPQLRRQTLLARLLGAQILPSQRVVVCDFRSASALTSD